jgi:hypothetical protein
MGKLILLVVIPTLVVVLFSWTMYRLVQAGTKESINDLKKSMDENMRMINEVKQLDKEVKEKYFDQKQ